MASLPLEILMAMSGRRKPPTPFDQAQAAGDYGVNASALAPALINSVVKTDQGVPVQGDRTNGGLGGANDHSTRNDLLMLLFGGGKAMVEQKANRQMLQQAVGNQRAGNAASRQAYNSSFTPEGMFDPDLYLKNTGAMGAALPSIEEIGRLDTMSGNRAKRGDDRSKLARELAASVVTPMLQQPEDVRAVMLPGARRQLVLASGGAIDEEMAAQILPDASEQTLRAAMSLGMGADTYIDNEREMMSVNETGRHNLRTEDLTASQQAEIARHNRADEGIGYGNLGVARGNLGMRGRELNQGAASNPNAAAIAAIEAELARRKGGR